MIMIMIFQSPGMMICRLLLTIVFFVSAQSSWAQDLSCQEIFSSAIGVSSSPSFSVILQQQVNPPTSGSEGLHQAPVEAQFSPDGNMLMVVSGSRVEIRNARTGQVQQTFLDVRRAQLSPDGEHLLIVTSSNFGVFEITGRELFTIRFRTNDWLTAAQFSPDGQSFLVASFDTTDRLATVMSYTVMGNRLREYSTSSYRQNTSALFAPDGTTPLHVQLQSDGSIILYNVESRKVILTLADQIERFNSIQYSPDFRTIMTTPGRGTGRPVNVWSAETGVRVRTLAHTGLVNSAHYSPNGRLIVTASDDSYARVWNADNGELVQILEGHTREVNSAHFSPDGQSIVTASRDGTYIVWGVNTDDL
jgi:WD40 repeat protein